MSTQGNENFVSSTPRQAVILYPYVFPYGRNAALNPIQVKRVDASNSVLSISMDNHKVNSSGSFTITLAPDSDWKATIHPGDWLMIYVSQFEIGAFKKEPDTQGLRCLGNVDRVTRQSQISADGTKKTVYKISGRDFGKIFEKTQFYFNPYVPDFITTNFIISKTGFMKITGTPADFIDSYINLYYGDGIQVKNDKKQTRLVDELNQMVIPQEIYKVFGISSGNARFKDLLRFEKGEGDLKPDGYSLSIPPQQALNGTVWEVLKSVSNPVINELYTTMKFYPAENRVLPTLVLRKMPFSKNVFTKVPAIHVGDNTIVAEDLGFSDHERYNYINFDPKNQLIGSYKQYMVTSTVRRKELFNGVEENVPIFPFIDRNSIQRYGFSSIGNLTTDFANISEAERKQGSNKQDIQLAESWQQLLIEWWGDYVRTENGTLVVRGFTKEVQVSASTRFNRNTSIPTVAPATVSISAANKIAVGVDDIVKQSTLLSAVKDVSVKTDMFNIGDNVYLTDKGKLYHLEGFEQEWTSPGEWQVVFVVTRGVIGKPNDPTFKFLDETEDSSAQRAPASTPTTKVTRDK